LIYGDEDIYADYVSPYANKWKAVDKNKDLRNAQM